MMILISFMKIRQLSPENIFTQLGWSEKFRICRGARYMGEVTWFGETRKTCKMLERKSLVTG
jgi:hypothetical protein